MLTTAAGANKATFETTDAKLSVSIMTLSIEGNAKLSKLLGERFKRFIYWNKDKVINNKKVGNSMIQLIKESNDSLFLLMIIQKATMTFLLILPKKIFFQELK